MTRLLELDPNRFAKRMLAEGQRRAYLVYEPHAHNYAASHELLQELADFLSADTHDARQHEAVLLGVGPETGALFGAVLHKTVRGQAQGGLRHLPYTRLLDFLRDGLRLSLGMTRKNALAGLWWGGGKGLIARLPGEAATDPGLRRTLYREYGSFVTSLRGCYVTAEDAGTSPTDMAEIHHSTRFATCVPHEVGGSGNPALMTATGVVCAMGAALEFEGLGSLDGKTIAMQGVGNVGSAMIGRLLEKGVGRIVASEISEERRAAVLDAFAGQPVEVRLVPPDRSEILSEECDVLAPNALGGVLDPKTIPTLRARIVCGSANNQLADDQRDGRALQERGITYVPDLVASRMGIVSCAYEQYGYVNNDPLVHRHLGREWRSGIHHTTLKVLGLARSSGTTPIEAANHLADERADQPHPIFGHRSRQIVESLIADHWEKNG